MRTFDRALSAAGCIVSAAACIVGAAGCIVGAVGCIVSAAACIVSAAGCIVSAADCIVSAADCIFSDGPSTHYRHAMNSNAMGSRRMFARKLACAAVCIGPLLVPATVGAQGHEQHPAGVSSVGLPHELRDRVSLRGAVVAVRPWREARGVPNWWEVELTGSGAIDQRMFAVYADRRADVPLRVGDVVTADVDCRSGGWHYVCSATVRDASSALLFAVAGSGEPGIAPGFTVTEIPGAPAAPGAPAVGRHEYPLRVEHAGRSIATDPSGHWVLLVAPDGRFAIHGSASRWDGGPRVPEAVDYTSYAITRLRAPSSH